MNKYISYMAGALILLGNTMLILAEKDDSRKAYEIYWKCFRNNSEIKEIKEQRAKLLKEENKLDRENRNEKSSEVLIKNAEKIERIKGDIEKLEHEERRIYKNCLFSTARSPETVARVLEMVDKDGPYSFPASKWRNRGYGDFSISKILETQYPNMVRREEAKKCLDGVEQYGNVATSVEQQQLYTTLRQCLHRNWIFTSQDAERVKQAQELTTNPMVLHLLNRIEKDIDSYAFMLEGAFFATIAMAATALSSASRSSMQSSMNDEQPSQASE